MIRDDAQRDVGGGIRSVFHAGEFCRRLDQGREEVGVVVVELALDDGGDPLESHAGVDAGRGQGSESAARVAIELHEDEIPDLEVAVAFAGDAEAGPTVFNLAAGERVTLIEVELRARAAGTGVAHGPEVVFLAQFENPLGGKIRAPVIESFGVPGHAVFALEDRGGKAILIEAHRSGEELPGERDRVFLEIVAEREVPEHLEERVMTRGQADVLEIVVFAAGADALLRRGGAVVAPGLAPQEHILELVHPRVGEEKGRVVLGNQRRTAHDLVLPLLEKLEERRTNRVGGQATRLRHGAYFLR